MVSLCYKEKELKRGSHSPKSCDSSEELRVSGGLWEELGRGCFGWATLPTLRPPTSCLKQQSQRQALRGIKAELRPHPEAEGLGLGSCKDIWTVWAPHLPLHCHPGTPRHTGDFL